jgi:hypothetical protein
LSLSKPVLLPHRGLSLSKPVRLGFDKLNQR